MGGVLCRPMSRFRCRDQSRRHGVSDTGAGARCGPAPVRRGRSRHGCLCRFNCLTQHVRRREAPRVCASTTLDCDPHLPDILVPFVRKMSAVNRSRSRALAWAVPSRKSWLQARCIFDCRLWSRGGHHTWNHVDASAITAAMLHLCSSPCKALRFRSARGSRGLRALTVAARR